MKQRAEKFYRTEIAVEGVGAFPFDMLRYDRCNPLTGEDASKLDHHCREHRVVILERFSSNGSLAEVDRWKSFGWRVIREDAHISDAAMLRKIGQ